MGPQANRSPSSTYIPREEEGQCVMLCNKADVYTMERTGERGDP